MVSINEDGSVELATIEATNNTTKATTSKTQKVKAVKAAAQVQKELCRQMLNLKKDDEHLVLKKENATLKRRVAELEEDVKQLKANNTGKTGNQSFTMGK